MSLLVVPMLAFASGPELHLDKAPDKTRDQAALQNGAKLFVNYCLNCHGASYMRYNRLKDIGLSEQQIKDNLMFTADKVGEQMKIAMRSSESKVWFGAAPPDLTVIARSRASEFGSGADWLYTYLRTFYRDPGRPTGWNNVVFENVGMPHVLWDLQGEQVAHFVEKDDGHGNKAKHLEKLEVVKPGKMNKEEYDNAVADLVSFLVYIGEPMAETRKKLGVGVLIALGVLFVLAYALKKNYWKDVH
ncbi:MAG TPA: cytochrome c1 [Rhodocyclaceae bacterium]|nr:cytochrome c1 [Rhodocyclaceae bacterium]HMV55197.1 cytochrome c1 [Rhodocyclaceae bacterium]HMZ84815.1 cytochrome c1 [Rhodocyclaceae bacterium]HNA05231.1 cytochrome c1 [Rhodocyclaceae bacterium]HNB77880.1 cytochrome c1 [Rhodocyclaceae bacterium]